MKEVSPSKVSAYKISLDPGDVGMDSNSKVSGLNNNSGPSKSTSVAQNNSKALISYSSSRSERCSNEPKIKRRKRARGCRSPLNGDASSRSNCPIQKSQESSSPSDDVSLDLNREPMASGLSHNLVEGSGETASNEFRQTVAIGIEIGFQMEVDNPILDEVVGGTGVNIPNQ